MNKIEAFGKSRYSKYMFGNIYDNDFLEWVDYIRDNIFNVNYNDILNDINNILIDKSFNKKNINRYYFDQIRFETYFNTDKFNIDECLSSLQIMRYIYNWCNNFNKLFPKKDLITDFYNFFRLSGIRTARLAGDYKCKDIDFILKKYNVNNVYYDPSAGWGSRMIIAAKNKIKYISTEPNIRLVRRLNMLGEDINRFINFDFKLYQQGSEIEIDEIKNKVGLIFTSPPYNDLEMYDNGNLKFDSYDTFVSNSVYNFNQYIINDGYIIINVDNKNYDVWFNYLSKYFTFICDYDLSFNVIRNYRNSNYNKKIELIMVFKKIITIK